MRPTVILDRKFPANWRVVLQQLGSLSLKHLRPMLTLDLSKLNSERLTAAGFNSRNGDTPHLGELMKMQRQTFDPPTEDDWVLVFDGE